jgi:aldehyde dehydrogenase (NAD+)
MTLLPLVSSVAAGNCTILKLPEGAPNTAELLARLFERYFDREYIATVTDSFSVVRALHTCKFDLVSYSGGSLVARIVARAAAEKLTPVMMNLSSKPPCIVTSRANLNLAARKIVSGKLKSAGQNPCAPDYLLVDTEVKEELYAYMKRYWQLYHEQPGILHPKMASRLHFDRMIAAMEDARKRGGRLVLGGGFNPENLKIDFTVIDNLPSSSKLLREEIFGPVLPVVEYSGLGAAVQYIKRRPAPLCAYIFTENRVEREFLLREICFGSGSVNDVGSQFTNPRLPFGGVRASGFGKIRGKSGFDAMSAKAAVIIS